VNTSADRWLRRAVILCAAVAVVQVIILSVSRLRQFSNDSMNYVTVARNVWDGFGLVQSAAGYNESVLNAESTLRPPLTAQPPLFPLLIVALQVLGISFSTAALFVAALGYAAVLVTLNRLAVSLYDTTTGTMVLALALMCLPLRHVGTFAWSETVALGLLLASLRLLVLARERDAGVNLTAAAAGLLIGLSFATRYASVVAVPIGVAFLFASLPARRRWAPAALYLAAFLLIALPIIGRNVAVSGTLLGPTRLPSTTGAIANAGRVVHQGLGTYLGSDRVVGWSAFAGKQPPDTGTQAGLLGLAACALVAAVVRWSRHDAPRQIANLLFSNGRWLPLACSLGYFVVLVWQRSMVHFDLIDVRLVAPGLVLLLVPAAALVFRAADRTPLSLVAAIALSLVVVIDQGRLILSLPPRQNAAARPARLQWIETHTSANDLIVGDDSVDIPFLYPGHEVVSFSFHPYSERLDYGRFTEWVCARAIRFDNIYFVFRHRTASEEDYGRFVSDVARGRIDAYPGLTPVAELDDATIARLSCAPRSPAVIVNPRGATD